MSTPDNKDEWEEYICSCGVYPHTGECSLSEDFGKPDNQADWLDIILQSLYDNGTGIRNDLPHYDPDTARAAITTKIAESEIKAKIDVYQRLMLWLEDQEDNDKLALLAKDISVELDKLFAELEAGLGGKE